MKRELVNKKIKGIDPFNTFPTFLKLIIIILLVIIILFLIPVTAITARDYDNDELLRVWRIHDSFTVSYIHSVELTEVLEIYSIEDKEIVLKETYFKSFGAGLPATTPYDFEITPNGFRIFNINETIESLVYRTGAVRAKHKLIIEDKEYDFLDFSKGQTAVHFQVENVSLLNCIIKEVIS